METETEMEQDTINKILTENKKLRVVNSMISYKLNTKDKLCEKQKKEIEQLSIALNGLKQENTYYKERIKELIKS